MSITNDEMEAMTRHMQAWEENAKFRTLHEQDIRDVLDKYLGRPSGDQPLLITRQVVTDRVFDTFPYSNVIINDFAPSVNEPAICYHYTNRPSSDSIANNKCLRLYWLRKLLSEDEYKTFYEHLGFYGSLRTKDPEDPFGYRKLCSDIFVFSFTDTLNNQERMWETFGDSGHGARIKFKITPKVTDLRRMHYGNNLNGSKLFKVNKELTERFNIKFIPYGLSKMGSFHLPKDYYSKESELRMLIKNGTDDYRFDLTAQTHNTNQYIDLPFTNEYYNIELLDIENKTM